MADLPTHGSPAAQTACAIGAEPVWSSRRWESVGLEIAHWEVQGPHHFTYGAQPCHGIAIVHSPLSNHLLFRNNKLVRQGRVGADRFRIAAPGEMIGAQVTGDEPIRMTHLYFSGSMLRTLARDLALPEGTTLPDAMWDHRSQDVEAVTQLIYRELCRKAAPDWVRLEFLAYYAISTIMRDGTETEPVRRMSPRIARVTQFIDAHLADPISLAELASAACVSKFHLCRIFRDEMGTTPHAFLQNRRVAEAVRMMHETTASLEDIAFRTGFASGASLSGALRRRYGKGPAAFRRR